MSLGSSFFLPVSCCPSIRAIKVPVKDRIKKNGHSCTDEKGMIDIDELNDGRFQASLNGGEYHSFVKYCPNCGKKARKYDNS